MVVSDLSQIAKYVLLSDAAYADFTFRDEQNNITGIFNSSTDPDKFAEALAARLSSTKKNVNAAQVQLVVQNYTLVAHQPDTDSGFSVTLFQDNATQEYVLAFRGTQGRQDLFGADIGDIVADGLAVDQIIDMYNWWQKISTPGGSNYQKAVLETDPALTAAYKSAMVGGPPATAAFIETLGSEYLAVSELESAGVQIKKLKTVDSGEKGLGLVPTGAELTITGHSLGGHLAAAFERLFPARAKETWMVNGAGFAGDSHSFAPRVTKNISHLFATLGGADVFNSTGKVNNIIGDKYLLAGNVVAMDKHWGLKQPGGTLDSFIEAADIDSLFGHGAAQMTDTVAVMSLFTDMAATTLGGLSKETQFSTLNSILKGAEADDKTTLEGVVHRLDVLFNGRDVENIVPGNRDKLFERIEAVRAAIAGNAANQNLTVHSISPYVGNAENLVTEAKNSLAYRYALQELNPFVVLGADYGPHNQNGELDLFDAATGRGSISESYLKDRAAMLAGLTDARERNRSLGDNLHSSPSVGAAQYWDAPSGIKLDSGWPIPHRQYGFGGAGADILHGADLEDHLYGMGGDDVLDGGRGANRLEGGAGNDMYIVHNDGQADTILDTDGQGVIRVGDMEASGEFVNRGEGGRFYSSDRQWMLHQRGGQWELSIRDGAGEYRGTALLEDWQSGELGLTTRQESPDYINADYSKWERFFLAVSLKGAPRGGRIVGSARNDYLTGSEYGDRIETGDGATNMVLAHGGDDFILGGAGNEFIRAGNVLRPDAPESDNDHVEGGGSSDVIYGGGGADVLYGGLAADDIDAASGESGDWLAGEEGDDALVGSGGQDFLFGGSRGDELRGEGFL